MEDESNIRLAYVTHEDIAACCPTETVLAVRVSLFSFTLCAMINCTNMLTAITKLCSGSYSLFFLWRLPLGPNLRCQDRRWKSGDEENTRFISKFVLHITVTKYTWYGIGLCLPNLKTETGQIGVVLLEDGERDSIVVQVRSYIFLHPSQVASFYWFCQVPPPTPSEVKDEGSLGVKSEERIGLEMDGMKREREEEQDAREFAKRQRLEEGEVVPEEGDGFSDSEVEQTLQGALPSLGHLQGTLSLCTCQTRKSANLNFRNGNFGFLLLARLFFTHHPGGDPRIRRSYVIRK